MTWAIYFSLKNKKLSTLLRQEKYFKNYLEASSSYIKDMWQKLEQITVRHNVPLNSDELKSFLRALLSLLIPELENKKTGYKFLQAAEILAEEKKKKNFRFTFRGI